MSNAIKLPLREAYEIAYDFRAMFAGTYQEWQYAGSLRRECESVGDLEHVVIPHFVSGPDLFGSPVNAVWQRIDKLVTRGEVTRHIYGASGFRWGLKYRGADFRNINNEIFCADEMNFGSTLAIRTGPAEFSRRLVTSLRPNNRRNQDGYVWNCRPCDADCKPGENQEVCELCGDTGLVLIEKVAAPDEETYFKLCGVEWVAPKDRK